MKDKSKDKALKSKAPKVKSPYLVRPLQKVKLSRLSTDETDGFKSEEAAAAVLAKHRSQLDSLQEVLYASQQKAVLIVLQGMDTAGKDGTIRHIFSGLNPEGCDVTSFKVPTPLEARHDFLWRTHVAVPPKGMIGIFNRSYYEDVLSPWVHKTISTKIVEQHLDDINEFEAMLADNDVVILKFFLHISNGEQKRRLQERIDTPDKQWKLAESDFHERKFWPRYEEAYNRILSTTSFKHAPWYVIPADHKWYRNVVISSILVEALEALKLKYPPPSVNLADLKL